MVPRVSPGAKRCAAWTLSNTWLPPQINLTDDCCEFSEEPATLCPGKTCRGETPALTPALCTGRHTECPDCSDVTPSDRTHSHPAAWPSAHGAVLRNSERPPACLQPRAPAPPSVCLGLTPPGASCEQSHTAFVSPRLGRFTGRHVLRVRPRCSLGPDFPPFEG